MSKKNSSKNVPSATDLFGAPTSEESVLAQIRMSPAVTSLYESFAPETQQKIMDFLTGRRGVEITTDGFFRKVLDPTAHRDRMESLLSALLEQKVRIERVETREGTPLTNDGSFVIMDIITSLEDGSMTNVEMQKVGSMFPSERSSCYVSDMIMRQYTKLKADLGNEFRYTVMKPVYLFVLMEISPQIFHSTPSQYIHRRQTSYDTGIALTELEKVNYICLDIFRENGKNKIENELDGWLTFLSRTDPETVCALVGKYPMFADCYREIAEFRKDPREVILMFSEALAIADRNDALDWVDDMHARIAAAQKEVEDLQQVKGTLQKENSALQHEKSTLLQENGTLQKENGTLQKENGTLQKENGTLQKENGTLQKENDSLKAEVARLQEQIRQLEEQS
jgi:FtsZ-binding cell division protein ZapB